ncbi:hypothetical protein HQ576_20150 [bacterium]|nr:hypothetical protein [bacterium]
MYWTPDPDHPVDKACTKCGHEKGLMEFYLDYKRGRRKQPCRECARDYHRRYYQATKESRRAKRLAALYRWREANPDRRREINRRYTEKHREKCRANSERWYWENRERALANGRRYRVENAEKAREACRRWQRANRAYLREYEREARVTHAQKYAARHASWALAKLGILHVPEACTECGGGPVELHHPDYSNPFLVVCLCHRCHMKRHRIGYVEEG